MRQDHFLQCLDELFELDAGTLGLDDVLQDVSGWSSLTFMGLIALVDDEYGITLSPTVVLNARTIGDLWGAIDRGGSAQAAA